MECFQEPPDLLTLCGERATMAVGTGQTQFQEATRERGWICLSSEAVF